MTYHDKRLTGLSRVHRNKLNRYRTLLDGASTITLWPRLNRPKIGSLADDWKAVGNDIRAALDKVAGE